MYYISMHSLRVNICFMNKICPATFFQVIHLLNLIHIFDIRCIVLHNDIGLKGMLRVL